MSAQLLRHIDEYLAIGQEAGASDVHLGVNAPPIWRLHGTLRPIWADAPKFAAEDTAALANGFLTELQKAQLAERGDADFAYANDFGRFRTSVVRHRLGIDILFRIINTRVRTMDELGLPEHLKMLTRYQRIGNGAPRSRHASYRQCIAHARSFARCLSGGSTRQGPGDGKRIVARRHYSAAHSADRRPGACSRARNSDQHPRRCQHY